jgi:hypothetical protein
VITCIESNIESFHVQQLYNSSKPPGAPSLNGQTWRYHTGYRDGSVPLIRKENGVIKSSLVTWGIHKGAGEGKYAGEGWPIQPAFIPATSFIMQVEDRLHPWAPHQFKVSRHDGAWFLVAACWYGAPALAERHCSVSVKSTPNLLHGLPYQPIVLTQEEWARGVSSGSMSLATMRVEAI